MRSFTLALAAMAVVGVSAQLDWAKLNAPGAAEYYYGIIPKCVVSQFAAHTGWVVKTYVDVA